MGMGIGINTNKADAGVLTGLQTPIACGVWFTSTGRTIPKMIRFSDEEGIVHTLTLFHIVWEEIGRAHV